MTSSTVPNRRYTARDVKDVAGLSYRQLNVWSARGVLPGDGGGDAGWRHFSGRELFALAVAVEIRRHFGVPVGGLGRVIETLRDGKTDLLVEAACLAAETAGEVWLVTDLEDTCILQTDAELAEFFEKGFRGDSPAGLILVKVSPLVKRLVARLREEEIPSGVRRMLETPEEGATPCTPEEAEVLRLIRSGEYRTIEVVMHDGEIKTLRTARPIAEVEPERVADLIREHEYQTVTVTQQGGRKLVIEQRVAHKLRG